MLSYIDIYGDDGCGVGVCGTPIECSVHIGRGVKLTLTFKDGKQRIFAHLTIVESHHPETTDLQGGLRPVAKVTGSNALEETRMLRRHLKRLQSRQVKHTWAIVAW